MGENKYVLAMYDVRGIQDYIFRTSKMKEAIGASYIVENLFEDALKDACEKKWGEDIERHANLIWNKDGKVLEYKEYDDEYDVQVLYIGGGNACVLYSGKTIAQEISKKMSKYVIDNTYSLQLAVAFVNKTDKYCDDYKALNNEMTKVKDIMRVSKPLGALPVMKTDLKTGYPISIDAEDIKKRKLNEESTESRLKAKAGDKARKKQGLSIPERIFDNYVVKKGEDSMLAVVHIDGNNMGKRIREQLENIKDYEKAVNTMRKLSFSINNAYKTVFDSMQENFRIYNDKTKEYDQSVLRIITAGDDITYVCTANIAMATVDCFCNLISNEALLDKKDDPKFLFSVCAGIAYFRSHFPFYVAYEVAEMCCSNAKERAKKEDNRDGERVGNWMDFQFCRNIKALDLKRIRKEEYNTGTGINLLRRPYYIPVGETFQGEGRFAKLAKPDSSKPDSLYSFGRFKQEMKKYVLNRDGIPRKFVKQIRNTYPLGKYQMDGLVAFLKSRDHEFPESMFQNTIGENGEELATAVLYDALEVADHYAEYEYYEKTEGEPQ